MKVIKRLELSTIEDNKRLHKDFKYLLEEIKIITKPFHTIENHQQRRGKQVKQSATNKQGSIIPTPTPTSHQPEESKSQQSSQYGQPSPVMNPLNPQSKFQSPQWHHKYKIPANLNSQHEETEKL